MPRIPRGYTKNIIYHVLNRGNNKQVTFQNSSDYTRFVSLLRETTEKFAIRYFAYCIMPNHFHLIMKSTCEDHLSKCMHWLLTAHVRRHHKTYNTSGHVWQGRFKSFLIQENNHLLTVIRYIERNPVRAELVKHAIDWDWSSLKERKTGNNIISNPSISIPDKWEDFVDIPLTQGEIDKIRLSIKRQTPFGDSEWQKKMCLSFGLQHTMRPRGRPPKSEKEKGDRLLYILKSSAIEK